MSHHDQPVVAGNSIHSILEELAQAATDKRDKGDKFERLMVGYFKADPLYAQKFSDVWLWNDWPGRDGQPDTGIDIVAKERDGDGYCAIQCKFYALDHTMQLPDFETFFTQSGKKPFTSRIIVSTTDKWGKHAEEAFEGQHTGVSRLRVQDLAESAVDWSKFSLKRPEALTLKKKKSIRAHQKAALEKVAEGFKAADRGKLIMACGTGKTYTALKIVEQLAPAHGLVLFLVPSLSLLSQTLKEWTAEAQVPLRSFAVCSDTKVGKKGENEDIRAHDLAYPATTDAKKLIAQIQAHTAKDKRLTVIFSTYQSIEVISKAQKDGLPAFDLVICDEAHRTTGVTLAGADESHFVRVHDNKHIQAKKRLYMTATPRIFGDGSKTQAEENDATLCSMDDEKVYGKEFHRLGFAEAVGAGLLSDYKVMVLAVDEAYISAEFQRQLAEDKELKLEDAAKIVGCWNGLSKRMARPEKGEEDEGLPVDFAPMRRAVAFAQNIKYSELIADRFAKVVDECHSKSNEDDLLRCEVKHVDGSFNILKRNERLDWLKEQTEANTCRILTNARCLSEGVDVPALDAVLFLSARDSIVDVVQSVGRVMRKAEGKQYGYVILPIAVPAGVSPEDALADHKKYKVVWQVLQSLRAHDDRFNATVNKIDLNKERPDQIQVIGVGGGGKEEEGGEKEKVDGKYGKALTGAQNLLNFNVEEWRNAIYAKIVVKCGDRQYWETWAKDVAQIAERHITRIKGLLKVTAHRAAFDKFLEGLRENLNPSVSEDDAIEMLAQHLITKPVFDALFEGYSFAKHNPVSIAMQGMLDMLEGQSLANEAERLDKFYASVKARASGIDNAEGKQKIVVELYDKFFRTAFPRMAERLGIVYTPVEVVDFIIKSADDALKAEFGVGLSDKGVHVLDPFTGTGTFMVRMLQSGLIREEDLKRKYLKELHANEIVLLAYYIAAINIEGAFHGQVGGKYRPFRGVALTDTFQQSEYDLKDSYPDANSKRVKRLKKTEIRVIVGNPPYSVGQGDENAGNKNQTYTNLDARIRATYAEHSSAVNKNSLYDSYIRAIRWASDRIKDKGIVCYVTNGSFIDSNSADGLRKCLAEEFTSVYCFNLRGNQRTSGELSRQEGGKIFGSGSRTPVAITILVKNPEKKGKFKLFYHDIGDYLTREEKLEIVKGFGSIAGLKKSWKKLSPNEEGDWINLRDPAFDKFLPLGEEDGKASRWMFETYSLGVKTNRDAWVYNFSKGDVESNMRRMIDFYNGQVADYKVVGAKSDIDGFVDNDATKINWTANLKTDLSKMKKHGFESEFLVQSMYRPYCKQWLYFSRSFNERVYQQPKIFPTPSHKNLVISATGIGASKGFSAVITNAVPNLHLHDTGQCFPLYHYEKPEAPKSNLFAASTTEPTYTRRDAIPDAILADFHKAYDGKITKEDIFYYVYGILHSPEYKTRFASDLKKMLPRLPMAKDFWAFSKAGRKLAEWHLNYEAVEPYQLTESAPAPKKGAKEFYRVEQMKFGKKDGAKDKTVIVYNPRLTLSGIPLEAYDYVVNGKPALEWIMERYAVTTHKDSGIRNDANDWSDDPTYIMNLVKRIVRVSVETVKIVEGLPALEERK